MPTDNSAHPHSFKGAVLHAQRVVTAATVAVLKGDESLLCNATAAAQAIDLPAASLWPGRRLRVKKTDSSVNAVTVTPAGSDKIDGASSKSLATQYKFVELESDGVANWEVFGSN